MKGPCLIIASVRNNIRKFRKYHGLTQQQLADRVGVSKNSISSYELQAFQPRVDVAARLCLALSCTPRALFDVALVMPEQEVL